MKNQKDHWEHTYSSKPNDRLGWFDTHLQSSLNLIDGLSLSKYARIIDIGGGASTLVDDLLERGYKSITVLDLANSALSSAKHRLGKTAEAVTWLEDDITTIDFPTYYFEVWHDRAVFHFLVSPEQQQQYRMNLLNALRPGGHVIIGTFAPEAPAKCSGLPVQRYSLEQLMTTLGDEFELMHHHKKLHITPGGVEQMYLYCCFRRTTQ